MEPLSHGQIADDLLAASNKMFADPKTMQIMTDSGAQVLGRVIGRNML